MINTLYVSTVDHDWKNSHSVLLDSHNIDKIINNVDAVDCHTSVEDLCCENIHRACHSARAIVLVDLDQNVSVTNNNCFSYGRLFNELNRQSHKVQPVLWNKDFNFLKHTRTNDDPVLWTAGCSITVGVGVNHRDRWGTLLGEYLQMPEISLSQGGSSIFWAADQLLRSDIRKNDIVVWGLTNLSRVQVSKNWNFQSITVSKYLDIPRQDQYWTTDYFESETQVLTALREIFQVINFCNKIGAKLYLANLLDIAWLSVILKNHKNFIDLTSNLVINQNTVEFIDLGSDNSHPGPRQHRQYATQIFNFIEETNHGQTI